MFRTVGLDDPSMSRTKLLGRSGGAGLAALFQSQAARVLGLCLGFLPVLGMALHNYYFGGVFVLFSSKPADLPDSYVRYAVNDLRRRFKMPGVPIRFTLRKPKNPFAGRARKR